MYMYIYIIKRRREYNLKIDHFCKLSSFKREESSFETEKGGEERS